MNIRLAIQNVLSHVYVSITIITLKRRILREITEMLQYKKTDYKRIYCVVGKRGTRGSTEIKFGCVMTGINV